MRNKKILLLLALALVTILVVAGCGSSTTSDNKDSSAKAEKTGLIETFQKSVHYTFFGDMIAKGPSIKNEDGEHYGDSCMGCHTAAKIIDDPAAKVDDFLPGGKYANKVEGITCRVCHSLSGKNGIELKKTGWETCGQCHIPGKNPDGTIRKPVLGGEVHHPQLIFVQGMGVGTVADTPSTKYQMSGFSCQDCHQMNENNHSFMVPGVKVESRKDFGRDKVSVDYTAMKTMFDQKKCQTCHKDNAQATVDKIKTQQEEIGKKLEDLTKTKEAVAKKYEAQLKETKLDPKTNKQVAKGYADFTDPKIKAYFEGNTYLSYVEADSSKGAHNYEFAKKLLEAADTSYKAAQ